MSVLNSCLNKTYAPPSWILQYPGSRFEEVCSRILQFYLNPFAGHGLHDLWLLALWRASGQGETLPFYNKVECVTEEYAGDKRIDIIVKSEEFIIAIENKTTADLYNPLDIYANHIRKNYPEKKTKNIGSLVSLSSIRFQK